jgi:predicted amidohydrolase
MDLIKPYTAVGLVTTVRGVTKRSEIRRNLEHIKEVMSAAAWLAGMDLPVRLVVLPEGALQGFTDEVFDLDHVTYAREVAIDIPGEETEYLGDLAKQFNVFIMGQAKAKHESFPDRYFNVGFVIDPSGSVILRHYKVAPLFPVEHSVTPFDVWDKWVELYGQTLQSFYPVVDTEIGKLGIMMANEGSYPENARGLAMNGAEVVYRASYPHPGTGNDYFEIQNRARALDNNFFVVAPNLGTYYLDQNTELPVDTFGGHSMIVDYKGRIIGKHEYGGGSGYVAGTIDVEALRDFRARSQWGNWMKDMQNEQYRLIYESSIYPKNLYLDRAPYHHQEYRKRVSEQVIRKLQEMNIWTAPSN